MAEVESAGEVFARAEAAQALLEGTLSRAEGDLPEAYARFHEVLEWAGGDNSGHDRRKYRGQAHRGLALCLQRMADRIDPSLSETHAEHQAELLVSAARHELAAERDAQDSPA